MLFRWTIFKPRENNTWNHGVSFGHSWQCSIPWTGTDNILTLKGHIRHSPKAIHTLSHWAVLPETLNITFKSPFKKILYGNHLKLNCIPRNLMLNPSITKIDVHVQYIKIGIEHKRAFRKQGLLVSNDPCIPHVYNWISFKLFNQNVLQTN